MQLILIADYGLIIVCFCWVSSFEWVGSSFPGAVLNICTCIWVMCFSQYHTKDDVVLIFWTFSQCYVEMFLYMDQNMVFPHIHSHLFSFEFAACCCETLIVMSPVVLSKYLRFHLSRSLIMWQMALLQTAKEMQCRACTVVQMHTAACNSLQKLKT